MWTSRSRSSLNIFHDSHRFRCCLHWHLRRILLTAVAAFNRQPTPPPPVTIRAASSKPTPRPTSDHRSGKFTREELGLARSAGINDAKWRNGARKAGCYRLAQGGFIGETPRTRQPCLWQSRKRSALPTGENGPSPPFRKTSSSTPSASYTAGKWRSLLSSTNLELSLDQTIWRTRWHHRHGHPRLGSVRTLDLHAPGRDYDIYFRTLSGDGRARSFEYSAVRIGSNEQPGAHLQQHSWTAKTSYGVSWSCLATKPGVKST